MHQADRTVYGIDKIYGATVGNVDAETDAAPIRDQAITTFKALVLRNWAIDNRDPISVHLLGGNEGRGAEFMLPSNFPMNAVQPGKRFRPVVRHLDTGDTQGEPVNDTGPHIQRREVFSRELTFVHLPDVVVRVVRVVVLV